MYPSFVSEINGMTFETIVTEEHGLFTLIRPLCLSLGLDYVIQCGRIVVNDDLSTVCRYFTVHEDGKIIKEFCVPFGQTLKWLYTINVSEVTPEMQEAFSEFMIECYNALRGLLPSPPSSCTD